MVGRHRLQPIAGQGLVQGRASPFVAAIALLRPVMPCLEGNRRRHRQIGRQIARALPLQPAFQHAAAGVGIKTGMATFARHIAPADHGGFDGAVPRWLHMHEGRALGGTHPFVAVAGVEIGTHFLQIKRHLAGRMGAVDQRRNAGCARPLAEFGHRQDQGRGRGDVAGKDQLRARADLGHHARSKFFGFEGQRQHHPAVMGADALAFAFPGCVASPVFMVGAEDFIARLQVQRACHDVDTGGGVGHEHQVFAAGAQVVRQCGAGLGQQQPRPASEKFHRIAFKFELPALVLLKHLAWTGPERAMVEEDQIGVEQEGVAHHATILALLVGRDRGANPQLLGLGQGGLVNLIWIISDCSPILARFALLKKSTCPAFSTPSRSATCNSPTASSWRR